jgi:hypothetical protein
MDTYLFHFKLHCRLIYSKLSNILTDMKRYFNILTYLTNITI